MTRQTVVVYELNVLVSLYFQQNCREACILTDRGGLRQIAVTPVTQSAAVA